MTEPTRPDALDRYYESQLAPDAWEPTKPCPTTTPEPHLLGEFPMTCFRCHLEADS